MPHRILRLSFYPAVISAGLALGASGAVVQVAQEKAAVDHRHEIAARVQAAYALEPAPPVVVTAQPTSPPYYGTAVALAGTSMAVFAVIAKGLMDFVFAYKARQQDAMSKQLEILVDQNKEGLESIKGLTAQLGEMQGRLEHANNNAKQQQLINAELSKRNAELLDRINANVARAAANSEAVVAKADANTRQIETITADVARLSGDEIPTA